MNFLTELIEGAAATGAAIRANKLRSVLATLGIVIGVVTVTLMGAAIGGLNRSFLNSIAALGGDVFYVQRDHWFIRSHDEWREMNKRPRFTIQQAREVERQATFARAAATVAHMQLRISFREREMERVSILGTTDQYAVTNGVGVTEGRFLTAAETDGGRPVCVIGAEVGARLFPGESPLGYRVEIAQATFEVVGVLERQGSFLGMVSLDEQAIIPLRQLVSTFWSDPDCQVHVKVADMEAMGEMREELRGMVRRIRRVAPGDPDDFSINEQEQLLEMFYRVAGTIATVGLFVTGLSLFVGGVGIMNIMFVSVAERTREIGICKALGARRRTILVQFILEATAICLAGGLLALAIAWPLTLAMASWFPARLSPSLVGLALAVSATIGLAAGGFPAWRAARMNPVDALRNE